MTDPPANSSPPSACAANGSRCACRFAAARRWSPYIVGLGIGVLSWITFAFMGKALGTSTTMVHASGLVCGVAAPDYVRNNTYYQSELNPAKSKMMFDWQWFLVLGVFGGAFTAAKLGQSHRAEHVPSLWAARFGPSKLIRYVAAFVGGVILIYGARMAGGCTSGHGISGSLQLALSSWTFFVAMFVSGVATAFALFGLKGRRHVDLA